MPQEHYIYAVTRVHTHEQNLLSAADIETLLAAASAEEALRILAEKGWGSEDKSVASQPEALADAELDAAWALIAEVTGGDLAAFDVLRLPDDYHNLKAAVKLAYTGADMKNAPRYLLRHGTQDTGLILHAAEEHDFTALPPAMAEAGREAYETLAETGNGQACDMAIDAACLAAIDEAGRASESALLQNYARLTVDCANIKAALRCAEMHKGEDFLRRAIPAAGSLDTEALIAAATNGMEDVLAYLRTTRYAEAVDQLEKSFAAFEGWCQNQLVALIRPQRQNYFGIEPLAAYILARQNEIAVVRVILSAKFNGFGEGAVRERLRDMYV